MNLVDLAEQSYKKFGERCVLVFENEKFTNRQMLQYARRFANGLKKLGLKAGDRIMVIMSNCPEVLISYQGILRMGGIVVPVVPTTAVKELSHIMKNSGAAAAVTSKELLPIVDQARQGIGSMQHILTVENGAGSSTLPFWQLLKSSSDSQIPLTIPSDDLALILYTAGTTGNPKGVMLSHKNLYVSAISSAAARDTTSSDITLSPLPLSHSYGITAMNLGYLYGNCYVLMRRFNVEGAFRLIDNYKTTMFTAVPAMLAMMLSSPLIDNFDLSSLRYCMCGSAPLSAALMYVFQKKIPTCRVLNGYGLSEAAPVVSIFPYDQPQIPESIGKPIPGVEVRIVDEDDKDVLRGEVGELIVRGENVSRGYYMMPEETAKTFRHGWLYTGDMARMDENGYLFLVERKKDLIIRGGFNIYPKDIEEIIYRHPSIQDAVAIGVPDQIMGEEIKLFIVAKPKKVITAEDVMAYCREQLSRNKWPKYIEFLDAIPRSFIGKVLRKELRERPL